MMARVTRSVLVVGVLCAGFGAGCASGGDPPPRGDVGLDGGVDPDADGGGQTDPGPGEGDCAPEDPPLPPDSLPECGLCDGARCVPNAILDDDEVALLAPCEDEGSSCVPDLFIETFGNFTLEECTSVAGAEGRCLSVCVPQVAEQASLLPQDICEPGWLCAPCFDPLTGEDTGACTQGCDEGPTEDPVTFPDCCGELGSCVPQELVPPEQLDQLGTDTCTGEGVMCAPNELANPSFVPPRCDSVGDFEGRCLPACLPDVAEQAHQLPQADCPDAHLCAPCFDPVTLEDTGACRLNGDEPEEPPEGFEACCGELGSCVPEELVPPEQLEQLGTDTCAEPGTLCAPNDLTDPTFTPVVCDSVAEAEGRCLPACLPDVAEQADMLPQDICPPEHLCAPCFDPTTGEDTGACRLNGDEPGSDPVTFSPCCDDLGQCVPEGLVPGDQRSQLSGAECADEGYLCAPNDMVQDPAFIPETCSSVAGAEGRCLLACLPDIAEQADRLPQDICQEGALCAPCYDPFTGEDTGACTISGDMPSEPPVTFDRCCSDRGACVPTDLVPPDQQEQLGPDTCSGAGELCAPDNLADPEFVPRSCASVGGGEGRCLPDCLPDVAEQADMLPQSSCVAGELCAPCYDPISGEDTGACRLNGDAPTEPPYVFDECCEGGARCVPSDVVPEAQQDQLSSEGCDEGAGELCVPNVFVENPDWSPPSCDPGDSGSILASFSDDGRCMPECVPDVQDPPLGLEFNQDICDDGFLCAPCTVYGIGFVPVDTGACDL